jgi:hypothetical protein
MPANDGWSKIPIQFSNSHDNQVEAVIASRRIGECAPNDRRREAAIHLVAQRKHGLLRRKCSSQ